MSASRAIGVDCGGTKIHAGVVGRDGTVDRRHTVPTPVSSEEDLLQALEEVVESLLGEDVAALGLGIPSQIDQRTGRAVSSVHVPLSDVDLRGRMSRFGLPVGIDNDGNAAAIAEWKLGAGRGASNLVLLTLGTGIGGGLILDGRPFRGSVGAGAELGHMVLDYGGPPCKGDCTGHGHFEAFAAGSAANALARRVLGRTPTPGGWSTKPRPAIRGDLRPGRARTQARSRHRLAREHLQPRARDHRWRLRGRGRVHPRPGARDAGGRGPPVAAGARPHRARGARRRGRDGWCGARRLRGARRASSCLSRQCTPASGPRSRGARAHPPPHQGCRALPRRSASSGLVLATHKRGSIA